MKVRHLGLALVVLLLTSGVAWAGKEAYRLVMSKDKELCEHVLGLFNADMKKYQAIRYQDHEEFKRIKWEPVVVKGEKRMDPSCSVLQHAIFDANNDGYDDIVIKLSACFRDRLSDSFYVFPKDSDVLTKLTPESYRALFEAQNKFDGERGYTLDELPLEQTDGLKQAIAGVFTIHPFVFQQRTYISMTSFRQEWFVINQYLGKDNFKDACYFQYQPTDTQDK